MQYSAQEIRGALDTLKLPTLVTREEIKSQYRYFAKKYHPDQGGTLEQIQKINSAYELLMSYIEGFRYSFDDEEIHRQFLGVDYAQKFRQ
jgi:DnaJ-class molecular chaperone